MKVLLIIVVAAGLGTVWIVDQRRTAALEQKVTIAKQRHAELDSLRLEQLRLRQLTQAAEPALDLHPRFGHAGDAAFVAPAAPQRDPMESGEWLGADQWQDRGRATPRAAVETALWAAAGGDLKRFENLLLVDDSVREEANALLDRLPTDVATTFRSAEHLVAAFTTAAIPLNEAQLVWEHAFEGGDSVACLFVRTIPDVADAHPTPSPPPAGDRPPPMGAPNPRTRAVYLTLRQDDDGWRVVVPAKAVQNIGERLGL